MTEQLPTDPPEEPDAGLAPDPELDEALDTSMEPDGDIEAEVNVDPLDALDTEIDDDDLIAAAETPYVSPDETGEADDASHGAPPASDTLPPSDPPPPHQPPPPNQPNYEAAPLRSGTEARQLFRSRRNRKLGGVAGGLARYLGVDPTVVRIAFVILAITGMSVLIYIAAWILIPQHPDGEPEPVWRPRETDRNLAIAVGLASLGLAVAILNESWLVLALVLIAGGVWLLSEQPKFDRGADHQPGSATAPGAAAKVTDTLVREPAMAGAPTGGTGAATATTGWEWGDAPAPGSPPPPPAPSGPQRVSRFVLSALALLIGLGIAAATGDWWDVSATRFLGIAIVIIGAGVVVGAARGHGARGLIPLGIIAVLLLIPVTAIEGLSDDGIGEATFQPVTLAELQTEYRHGVGELTVDLTQLDLDGASRTVEIDLGIGELNVLLPADVGGTARLEVSAGEIAVDFPGSDSDRTEEGLDVAIEGITLPGDRGSLDLDIEVGLGAAELRSN